MYHHSFLFKIISENNKVEAALKEVTPLEDCDYTFETIPAVAADTGKPDLAYIYDCIGKSEFHGHDISSAECVLLIDNENPLLKNKDIVSYVSDLWVVSEDYDSELLQIHFERLANRMKKDADARKYGICFDTILNSVPDIAWFKDTVGSHLIVNDSFCDMVGKTKEQIYKKGHCYIWDASKEDEEVCLKSDAIIMESRRTNTFEESIKAKHEIRLLKSYKSALVDTDGEIFGTCGIAHDVTELKNISTELDMILDSMPYAVLVESVDNIVFNKNKKFDEYFPAFGDIIGKSSEAWKKSLAKKLLVEDEIKEIVTLAGDDERVLVFDEESIMDGAGGTIGKLVTLTDITLERSISRRNEYRANTDFLTKLSNRRGLMSFLEEVYDQKNITLIMLDLDNFKQVNDTYGHEAGDNALVKTAQILNECFSEAFISRMGGDEFLIVVCDKEESQTIRDTKHLLYTMRTEYESQKEFQGITASAGIVSKEKLDTKEKNVSDILQMADEMLYKAKNNGKNCCFVYGEDN
ncbi:MAG: diguanylate cyclase [Clostridium sp.]|nr:diguanylate cyclase [Clostridium sp.]